MSRSELDEYIAKLEKDAYARGWHDAIERMKLDLDLMSIIAPDAPSAEKLGKNETYSTQQVVHNFIKEHSGMVGSQIIRELRKKHASMEERTIRTAFFRLKDKGKIEKRDKKWFFLKE